MLSYAITSRSLSLLSSHTCFLGTFYTFHAAGQPFISCTQTGVKKQYAMNVLIVNDMHDCTAYICVNIFNRNLLIKNHHLIIIWYQIIRTRVRRWDISLPAACIDVVGVESAAHRSLGIFLQASNGRITLYYSILTLLLWVGTGTQYYCRPIYSSCCPNTHCILLSLWSELSQPKISTGEFDLAGCPQMYNCVIIIWLYIIYTYTLYTCLYKYMITSSSLRSLSDVCPDRPFWPYSPRRSIVSCELRLDPLWYSNLPQMSMSKVHRLRLQKIWTMSYYRYMLRHIIFIICLIWL